MAFDQGLPARVELHRVFRSGVKTYLRRVFSAMKVVRSHEIDTVLLSGKFSLWTGLLLKVGGVRSPMVAILHGYEIKPKNRVARWFTRMAIELADQLIPVSAFTESLLPSKIRQQGKTTIIPNGIMVNEFPANVEKLTKLAGSPVLLTVGNVTLRKGQHRVIRAMPAILKTFPDACYHMVGLPTLRMEFEGLADDLGVQEHVVFHGHLPSREELFEAYRSADVFCILSENQPNGDVEGFGIVVLEANMLGLPAIGAKGCGISDAIKDGINGYLVDGDSPEDVADALSDLLKQRKEMAVTSRKWAEDHDWDQLVERFLKVIEQVG